MLEYAGKKGMLIYPENLLNIIGANLDSKITALMIILLNCDSDGKVKTSKINRIISETLSVDIDYVSRIIMTLNKEGYLERLGRGSYIVNPYLFSNRKKSMENRYNFNELFEE